MTAIPWPQSQFGSIPFGMFKLEEVLSVSPKTAPIPYTADEIAQETRDYKCVLFFNSSEVNFQPFTHHDKAYNGNQNKSKIQLV